jgi:ABC-type transport system involved in multi-copper enzyme maturation permease subunit
MSNLTAPAPTAGGTTLLHYRPYRGRFLGPGYAAWAIARSGLRTILRRKLFWGLYFCGIMIFLFFFFSQYLLRYLGSQLNETTITISPTSRIRVDPAQLLGYFQTQLKINGSGETYRNVIWYEGFVVMIVLALAGSVLVGNDFRFGSLPFYLSKPLGRWHYVLGKCLAVAVFVNLLTTVLALLLWLEYGFLDTSWDYLLTSGRTVLGIIGYGMVLTVFLSLLLVATASWLRKTVPMVMVWTALFVFARGLRDMLERMRPDEPRWRLVDLWYDAYLVGGWCLGLPQEVGQPAVREAALVLAAVVVACLIYLNRRIRAVEVV